MGFSALHASLLFSFRAVCIITSYIYVVSGGRLRGTAFDFEHLFSNSVCGRPLHGEYPLRSVALPRMYAYIVRSRLYVPACVRTYSRLFTRSKLRARGRRAAFECSPCRLHVVFIRLREPGSWTQRLRKGVTKLCLALGILLH